MKRTARWLVIGILAAAAAAAQEVTARQIVERIQKEVAVPWSEKTVDTFKIGNPDAKVTGVATTFMATVEVLEKAAARGANFIITHEPTFYNHLDETDDFADDAVVEAKRALIEKHGLVVWRFHDHWHRRRPDGIYEGMVKKLGWNEFRHPDDPALFTVPETTVAALAKQLEARFDHAAIRVVGNPGMPGTKVALAPGAPSSMSHIKLLRRDDVEVLVAGEAREWETVEYVRDAAAEGKRKAVIFLGHVNSEEAGMDECAEWLKGFVREVPVQFIPAGDPFWTTH